MTPAVHEWKTWPEPFQAMWDRLKTFEFRIDDRGAEVGDSGIFKEYDPLVGFTGRVITADIIYMIKGGQFGIPKGYHIIQLSSMKNFKGR